MNKVEILEYAMRLYSRGPYMSQAERAEAVAYLAQAAVFSVTHLSTLSTASRATVRRAVGTAYAVTAGKFNPHSMDVLLRLAEDHERGYPVRGELVARATQAGTSWGMIERLTGVSQSTIARRRKDVRL